MIGRYFPTPIPTRPMTEGPHVVGIVGSLRDGSHTRTATRSALAAAAEVGATTDLLDLRRLDLPMFDPDDRNAGDAAVLRRRVDDADAVILGTPMYHGSYGSPVKAALDYCGFDEFEHKTVGLLGVSGGSFPITALDHLRSVCRALDVWVLPYQAAVPNAGDRVDGGEIVDEGTRERVRTLGRRVVRFASIEPDPPSFESGQNVGASD